MTLKRWKPKCWSMTAKQGEMSTVYSGLLQLFHPFTVHVSWCHHCIDGQESSTCDNCPSVQWMVNLEGSAQVKRTTLLGYNLVYSISSEVVLGVSCCCVLSPFISHHDSHLFSELKLCGYLCCHFFLFRFYGFSQMQECKCLLLVCLFSCRSVGADIWHSNVNG